MNQPLLEERRDKLRDALAQLQRLGWPKHAIEAESDRCTLHLLQDERDTRSFDNQAINDNAAYQG